MSAGSEGAATAVLAGRRALFVSWISHHGRSADLSAALGAEAVFIATGRLTDRRTAPFRHAVQAVRTVRLLRARRPDVLLVMAPPAALVLIGLVWRRLTGGRLVVDAHSGAVLGRPLAWRLGRHADCTVVTLPSLTEGLPRAVALHDPPAAAVPAAPHGEVVFPASWYSDEPHEDLVEAARLLPDVRLAVTGRPPQALDVPPNLRLTGFLPREQYLELVAGAPLVLALTTRPETMQRAAYEAVAAGRPVVASDTAALRSYLGPAAVYAGRGGPALAAAVSEALRRAGELEAAATQVREQQRAAFQDGVRALGEAVR